MDSRNTRFNDIFLIYLHVLIAFAFLPAYINLGDSFKFLAAPYILYLVWSENPKYFPALIVHTAAGSTMAIFILLLCAVKTVKYYKMLSYLTNRWLLYLIFLPAPLFIYQTIMRFFILDYNFIESVIPLGFYLGIFPFFYGIIMSEKMTNTILKSIMLVLFFIPFASRFEFIGYLRASSFSFVLFVAIGLTIIFPIKFNLEVDKKFKFIGLYFIISTVIGFSGIKFHIQFVVLLTILILFLYLKKQKFILSYFAKPRLIFLSIIIVVYVANQSYEYSSSFRGPVYYEYDEIESYPEFIQFKAFADRGLLWASVWNNIMSEKRLFPPYEIESYYRLTRYDIISNTTYGAHNIVLELLRNYGLIVGFVVSLIYTTLIILLGKIFFHIVKNHYILLLGAAAMGIGIVVGITGQYVLMINFSFLLLGISGLCYGSFAFFESYNLSKNIKLKT